MGLVGLILPSPTDQVEATTREWGSNAKLRDGRHELSAFRHLWEEVGKGMADGKSVCVKP